MENSDMLILEGVTETMLQTLYARAHQSQSSKPVFRDIKAEEVVKRINYDFSEAEKDKKMEQVVVLRTVVLDKLVREFLENNPNTTVVNIACGMDSRCYRYEGMFFNWYNLDLPDVMDIRSRFMEESDSIHNISGSVMDDKWLSRIDVFPGGKVLVIIEGLTMYLSDEKIRRLFEILSSGFTDTTIFAEVLSTFYVKNVKMKSIEKTKSTFTWGTNSGRDLTRLASDFRHVKDLSYSAGALGRVPLVNRWSNKIVVLEKQ